VSVRADPTYALLRLLFRAGLRVVLGGALTVAGTARVPRAGGLLVCTNHISTLDPALVPGCLPRDDSWSLGKAEYFTGRGWRPWLFRAYHGIPIARHSADRAALRRAAAVLRDGGALCIYPEGTRRGAAGMRRPEPGAGFLALRTGVTVQPVAVAGTQDVLGPGARRPRRAPVRLVFGDPFTLAAEHRDGRRATAQDGSDAIMLSVAELLPPPLRGELADLDAWRSRVGDLRRYPVSGPRRSAGTRPGPRPGPPASPRTAARGR
jgi:1-acyl-sn-glycerol-3-phosphate acyltransferase